MSTLEEIKEKIKPKTKFENLPDRLEDPAWIDIKRECKLSLEDFLILKKAAGVFCYLIFFIIVMFIFKEMNYYFAMIQ